MPTAAGFSRHHRSRRVFLAMVCCAITTIATAPALRADDEWNDGRHGGKGYFMIGWSSLDLEPLNDVLVANGYPTFTKDFMSLGGGGHAVIGRLVLGGQGHGYLSQAHDATLPAGNYRTSVAGGAGFFDLGLLLWSRGATSFTPMVGLGGGGLELDIRELSSPTFSEVLAQPGRRAKLHTGGFLVDLGASLDRIVDGGRGNGGPLVGIRAGWVLAPFPGHWQLHGQDVAGGPELGFTGPYVRFMFGGGGMGR